MKTLNLKPLELKTLDFSIKVNENKKIVTYTLNSKVSSDIAYKLKNDVIKITKIVKIEKIINYNNTMHTSNIDVYLNGEDKLWVDVVEISLIGKPTLYDTMKDLLNEKIKILDNSHLHHFMINKQD